MNRNYQTIRRSGSALLMAMVLTVILFILGVAFISTSRTDKQAASSMNADKRLNDAVDSVIQRINTVLVDDLFGKDGNLLNNDSSDEYFDYPGAADPWLATLEPEQIMVGTNQFYFWRHITDLYFNNFAMPPTPAYFDPDDINDTSQYDSTQTLAWWYWVANITPTTHKYTVARIVDPDDGIGVIMDNDITSVLDWGGRADADGDGVADSRWVPVPTLTGSDGTQIYTAVRIIDNGGMININTAYRNPTFSTNPRGQWDGSRLSHVNLEGIRASSEPPENIDDLRNARYGTVTRPRPYNSYEMDTQYDNDVSQRILNPRVVSATENYMPFDISDELELRNRFLLRTDIYTRSNMTWPTTFYPPPGLVGRDLPYAPGDDITAWFDKLKPDIDEPGWTSGDPVINYYNRRHLVTTYNFDRPMVPWQDVAAMSPSLLSRPHGWYAWSNWDNFVTTQPRNYRPICLNDYDPLTADTNPNIPTLEQIAAAIWMGLPDGGTILDTMPQFGNILPAWSDADARERLACQLAVNLIDYIDTDNVITDFNPRTPVGATADHYYGYESNGNNVYISKVGVSRYREDDGAGNPGPLHTHYAIELYNPGIASVDVGNWQITVAGSIFTIPAGTTVPAGGVQVLIDIIDIVDPDYGFNEPGLTAIGATFQFGINNDIYLLDNSSGNLRPLDMIRFTIDAPDVTLSNLNVRYVYVLDRGSRVVGLSSTNNIIPAWDLTRINWNGGVTPSPQMRSLGSFAPIDTSAVIQTQVADNTLLTVGEFYNVLAVGSMNLNGTYVTMTGCWGRILAEGTDLTDIEAKAITSGRIDVSDIDFANLTRYLTVFNPFNDFEDPPTNSIPIDNDDSGTPNDPNELAIAGRININTAPWYVIAQLPWLRDPALDPEVPSEYEDQVSLARAIVAYRDKARLNDDVNYAPRIPGDPDYTDWLNWIAPDPTALSAESRKFGMGLDLADPNVRTDAGFANITELLNVTQNLDIAEAIYPFYDFRRYGRAPGDMAGRFFPDMTGNDGADNDLEERDILFHRVSNLVTVRSDVFTAYILVRLGANGPQRRMIAIFDRSNVYDPADKPRLVALHPVPDPR